MMDSNPVIIKPLYATVIAACMVMFTLGGAHAQALWGKTHFGMSINEVQTTVPDVKLCNKPVGHLYGGASGILCKKEITIANEQFTAIFYFKSEILTQVTLELQGKQDFSSAKLTFDSFADIIRSKYGHELSLKSQQELLSLAEANWTSGATNILLYCSSVDNGPATLNINYQARTSQDATKL